MLNESATLESVNSEALGVYPLPKKLHHPQPRTLRDAVRHCRDQVCSNKLTVFVVNGKTRINGAHSELFLFATTENKESGCSVNPLLCVSRQWKDHNGCQGDCECLQQAFAKEIGSFVLATRQMVAINGNKVSGVCLNATFKNHIDNAVKIADQPHFKYGVDSCSLHPTT